MLDYNKTNLNEICFVLDYSSVAHLSAQLKRCRGVLVMNKGSAGVPRGSLVVVTAVLSMFHLPQAGIALILPIDFVCDMFRTTTNVLGNALATAAVSKWEGELAD